MGIIGNTVEAALILGALAVGGSVVALKSCSTESISYSTKLPAENVERLKGSLSGIESALAYAGDAVKSAGEVYQKTAEKGYRKAEQTVKKEKRDSLDNLSDRLEKLY